MVKHVAFSPEIRLHVHYVKYNAALQYFKGPDLFESGGLFLPEQVSITCPSLVYLGSC